MLLKTLKNVDFFWGDRENCPVDHRTSDFLPYGRELCRMLDLNSLVLLKQVHGNNGRYVGVPKQSDKVIDFFNYSGDYLITDVSGIGIAVLTADCLPIVLFDYLNNGAAIIHAGWRGTHLNIFSNALKSLTKKSSTGSYEHVLCWLGPAARSCCYEVTAAFVSEFVPKEWVHDIVVRRNNMFFIDISMWNILIARKCGIPAENIDRNDNYCTICNNKYYSFRRQGSLSLRQISVAYLPVKRWGKS